MLFSANAESGCFTQNWNPHTKLKVIIDAPDFF
jgi:hypothetical protein